MLHAPAKQRKEDALASATRATKEYPYCKDHHEQNHRQQNQPGYRHDRPPFL